MVDVVQLPVSQRLLVFWQRDIRVGLNFEVENMVAECLGRAEGGKEEGGAKRLTGQEELNREIFLCLGTLLTFVS